MKTSKFIDYQNQHHRPGYIYLIHQQGTDRYKIGLTSSPEKRLKQLQTGSSDRLTFTHLIQVPDMSQTELSLHRLYARQRIRADGEWFKFANHEIAGVIRSMDVCQSVRSTESRESLPRVWLNNLGLAGLVALTCLLLLWWEGVAHQRRLKPVPAHPVTGSQKF